MIELREITKIYKVGGEDFYALRDVTLCIRDGEMLAIQGASGSGKTTLLNLLGCLDNPTAGSYLFDGREVFQLREGKKAALRGSEIGFVLQDFALIDGKSVLYNVMLPMLFTRKVPYRKLRTKALAALEQVGLASQYGKKANQLSGGQRQRVAIARAIVCSPKLVLADEPTGQLDSATGAQILEILRKLNEDGITVVLVTHDEKIAAACPRRCFMQDGILTEEKKQETA